MRFLVLQHLNVEHPGIFCDFWRSAGVEWTTIELDDGQPIPSQLEIYDAMIVMGGPMDVWQKAEHPWLIPEIEAIRRFAGEMRKPYLGVCLGHQLLAVALGGAVGPAGAPEVGPCQVRLTKKAENDALLGGLPSPVTTFQWHSAEVQRLPPDSVCLAETDLCRIQAFRYHACAYGLQFHAEITKDTVDDWGQIPAYEQALVATLGSDALARLSIETRGLLQAFHQTASYLNENFLRIVARHKLNAS